MFHSQVKPKDLFVLKEWKSCTQNPLLCTVSLLMLGKVGTTKANEPLCLPHFPSAKQHSVPWCFVDVTPGCHVYCQQYFLNSILHLEIICLRMQEKGKGVITWVLLQSQCPTGVFKEQFQSPWKPLVDGASIHSGWRGLP